jgi:hypothetical protein
MRKLVILMFFTINVFGQEKDTLLIFFQNEYKEMNSVDYTHLMQAGLLRKNLKSPLHI